MDSKFLKNWIFWFYSKEGFAKKDYKNQLLFYCCKIKTAFSLFSLLFNVKSGFILIQKLVFIHNPWDISGQVELFCCKTEIFLSFSFLLTERS